jgi:hypothetical protein
LLLLLLLEKLGYVMPHQQGDEEENLLHVYGKFACSTPTRSSSEQLYSSIFK